MCIQGYTPDIKERIMGENYVEACLTRNRILANVSGRPEIKYTFEADDKLNLGKYGQNLQAIIKASHTLARSNDNKSYVIGLDASWGAGKTTFLSMMYYSMEKTPADEESDIMPVYYNAWKGDFWNNAFEPFFDCIWNSIPDWSDAEILASLAEKWGIPLTTRGEAAVDIAVDKDTKSVKEMVSHGIRLIGWVIASYIAKPFTAEMDSDIRKKVNAEFSSVLDKVMRKDEEVSDFFPEYSVFKNAIKMLQDFLSSLTGDNRKVVVFVDELDRCRPDFAVQTLEIIKHMFNVENIVFVIALDINQLSNTVKNVYGAGFDSVGYLERFFNLLMQMPMGRCVNYVSIVDAVQEEIIKCIEKGKKKKHQDIIRGYETYRWDEIKNDFSSIAFEFGLSLREFRRILMNMHIVEEFVLKEYLGYKSARVLYFYCLVLKYKYPLEFSKAVFKHDNSDLLDILPRHNNRDVGKEPWYIQSFSSESLADRIMQVFDKIVQSVDLMISSLFYDELRLDGDEYVKEYTRIGFADLKSEEGLCYSYVLYPPDVKNIATIKEKTILEYLYRELEMFDVNVTIDV